MQKIFSLILLLLITTGLMLQNVDAKRFGGGRSFGVQRSASSFSQARTATAPLSGATGNKWLGPLAGLAIGSVLGSLLFGHGAGSGILSMLMLAAVAFFGLSFLRSRAQGTRPAQFNNSNTYENQAQYTQPINNVSQFSPVNNPAGFDSTEFLRDAKVQFIRLQAAFDSKNLEDLRQFTSPEVFGEIQLQLQERGNEANVTEVISVNAELLDVASEAYGTAATVRFTGMIKEETNGVAAPFTETWHFNKPNNTTAWKVTGVQQQ